MAFYSTEDPALWGRGADKIAAIAEAGGMEGFQIANFVLGSAEENSPVATVLKMEPGHVLPRHGHNCWRFEVVVQGTITIPDGTVLKPGSLMFSGPNELYGRHVAGPEGATTVEVFSTYSGSHSIVVEGPNGTVECDMRDRGDVDTLLGLFADQVPG